MAHVTFAENVTDADSESAEFTISRVGRAEIMALYIRGVDSATVTLEMKDPGGTFVLVSSTPTLDADGVYTFPAFPGTFKLSWTGTPTGLYAYLETSNEATRRARLS